MTFKDVKLCKSEQQVLCTYCPNIYCVGKVKYKLIMRMGGDLFELELYHKIIKKNVWFFVTYEKPHLNIHCRNFIDYMSFQIQNLS